MKKKSAIRSVGVLCSGGDAPGMNAAIRAVVRSGIYHKLKIFGIYKGYSGLLEGHIEELSLRSVANIIQRGGTVLKTDRCPAFHKMKARAEAAHILRRNGIDALAVIGGDGSYTGAYLLGKENDLPVVGIPGTIDNDIYGSDYTIGFDTAVNTAVEAIDKIRDTASSHDRVFLVEVMGRTSTEIAARVAVCGGAETIVVPGKDPKHVQLIKLLQRSKASGKLSSIVIVTEGDHAGHSDRIAEDLKKQAGMDSRVAILGHIQRGGTPTAMDRFMASCMGHEAVLALLRGEKRSAVCQVRGEIVTRPLEPIVRHRHKKPQKKLIELVEILSS